METLIEITQIVWPVMADFLLQSTLLLGTVLLAYVLCRALSSARRHALLLTGMLAIPVLLFIVIATPLQWQLPGTGNQSQVSNMSPAPIVITPIPLEREARISSVPLATSASVDQNVATAKVAHPATTPIEHIAASDSKESAVSSLQWTTLIAIAWLAGTIICLSRLAIGWLSLQVAALQFHPLEEGNVRDSFDSILGSHSQFLQTRLLESHDASMPMTFGINRPAVVMPGDAECWTSARMRRVLLHELAHVSRRDTLTNALALLGSCLIWFHPLVWITWRLLRREQESAADDWAIQRSSDAEAYADDLVAMVREYPKHLHGMGLALSIAMARGNQSLKRRLDVLLDNRRDRSICGLRLILTTLPIWMAAVIGLGGMVACRDQLKSTPVASVTSDEQQTRTFVLSPTLQKRLLVAVEKDPFSDSPPLAKYKLQESIGRITDDIARLGIPSPVSNISLRDRGTLIVTANASAIATIEEWLSALDGTDDVRILISTKVFQAPNDVDLDAVLNVVAPPESDENVWAGTLTASSGQSLFQSLKEREDFTLVQVPSLTTRSGNRAKFENIREFIYPTEFDPPELPQKTGSANGASELNAQRTEIIRLQTLLNLDGTEIIEGADVLGIESTTISKMFPRMLELQAQRASMIATAGKEQELEALDAELAKVQQLLEKGVEIARNAMHTQLRILENTAIPQSAASKLTSILPSVPTAFETRNVGTSFEFLPQILPDGRIDLKLDLEHVRFLGFVDYGSPIQTSGPEGNPVVQENKIQQPIMETSKCSSSTTLAAGSWVVVSGLGAKATSGAPSLEELTSKKFESAGNSADSQFVILIHVAMDNSYAPK